jgi:hypothetical protein
VDTTTVTFFLDVDYSSVDLQELQQLLRAALAALGLTVLDLRLFPGSVIVEVDLANEEADTLMTSLESISVTTGGRTLVALEENPSALEASSGADLSKRSALSSDSVLGLFLAVLVGVYIIIFLGSFALRTRQCSPRNRLGKVHGSASTYNNPVYEHDGSSGSTLSDKTYLTIGESGMSATPPVLHKDTAMVVDFGFGDSNGGGGGRGGHAGGGQPLGGVRHAALEMPCDDDAGSDT